MAWLTKKLFFEPWCQQLQYENYLKKVSVVPEGSCPHKNKKTSWTFEFSASHLVKWKQRSERVQKGWVNRWAPGTRVNPVSISPSLCLYCCVPRGSEVSLAERDSLITDWPRVTLRTPTDMLAGSSDSICVSEDITRVVSASPFISFTPSHQSDSSFLLLMQTNPLSCCLPSDILSLANTLETLRLLYKRSSPAQAYERTHQPLFLQLSFPGYYNRCSPGTTNCWTLRGSLHWIFQWYSRVLFETRRST